MLWARCSVKKPARGPDCGLEEVGGYRTFPGRIEQSSEWDKEEHGMQVQQAEELFLQYICAQLPPIRELDDTSEAHDLLNEGAKQVKFLKKLKRPSGAQ